MNQARYQAMIAKHSEKWLRACHGGRLPHRVSLVQDHEKCLWADASLACLAEHHLYPLATPTSSPDLDVIEGVWALLRTELNEGAPVGVESREDFITRLGAAVARLNRRQEILLSMCNSMKDRARDVLEGRGAMTEW